MSSTKTSFLQRPDGRPLAYRRSTAARRPGVVFAGGLMSRMSRQDAVFFDALAERLGHSFVRFDYSRLAESNCDAAATYSLDEWRRDLLAVLDHCTDGPQVLVGASMGAWLSLLAARERPARVAAVLAVSTGCGFWNRIPPCIPLSVENARLVEQGAQVMLPCPDGSEVPTSQLLMAEDKHWDLTAGSEPILIHCPVRFVHCISDIYAPFEVVLDLSKRIVSTDVDVILRKEGGHDMMSDRDKNLLSTTLSGLLNQLSSENGTA